METTPVVGQWYRSTIDGVTQGKVVKVERGMVTVLIYRGPGRHDTCTINEFADSWERA